MPLRMQGSIGVHIYYRPPSEIRHRALATLNFVLRTLPITHVLHLHTSGVRKPAPLAFISSIAYPIFHSLVLHSATIMDMTRMKMSLFVKNRMRTTTRRSGHGASGLK